MDWLRKEHLSHLQKRGKAAEGRAGAGAAAGGGGLNLNDPKTQANLRALAEVAKIQLSSSEEVTLR